MYIDFLLKTIYYLNVTIQISKSLIYMKVLTKGIYYGEKKLELDNKGVIISEYDYTLPETDWHFHENPYFMYVIQGNVLDINKKQKTLCPPGSFLLHNWNDAHQNTKESSFARGFHIEFERSWFDNKKLNINLWEGSRLIENQKMHHLLWKLYLEFRNQDAYSKVSIDLLLLELCETTQSDETLESKKQPSWITPLKELLHEHTESLSLEYLSEQLGVHPVHLSRSIPKYLSTTLGDYMRQQKIKKALSYLMNPNHSLTDVAYLSGFSDQSHFIRTFKSYFNKTPKVFRSELS